MSQAVKCLIMLAVIALLFVTELIPLAVTAMGGAIACGLLGFIPAKQVFSGLSNSTVVPVSYTHLTLPTNSLV